MPPFWSFPVEYDRGDGKNLSAKLKDGREVKFDLSCDVDGSTPNEDEYTLLGEGTLKTDINGKEVKGQQKTALFYKRK